MPMPIDPRDESLIAAGLWEALEIAGGPLSARVGAFLRVVAAGCGDPRIRHAARVLAAAPSPGRPELDDEDVLGEIFAMIARGIGSRVAIATVARRVGADANAAHRWRRKLRARKKSGHNQY
jgi:hypothetical protein